MTWSCALASAFWILSAQASGSGAGWQRNRTCLTGVVPYAAGERKNVTVDGVSGPLKIGTGDSEVGMLVGLLAGVLIEEVLGFNVEFTARLGSSAECLAAVSGCKNPAAVPDMERAECDTPGPPLSHIQLTIWNRAETIEVDEWIWNNRREQYPNLVGSIGFSGKDSFFLPNSPTRPGLLEYCKAYSDPRIDASSFFDSMDNISTSDLAPCSETILGSQDKAELFFDATQDAADVNDAGDAFTCTNNHWWIAPACRADVSKCIPAISPAISFWDSLQVLAQRAVRWQMPLALATTKDWTAYTTLPETFRVVTYWSYPDITFLRLNPVWLQFPPHNAEEWGAGIYFSDSPSTDIGKWAYAGLPITVGTSMLGDFMQDMKVTIFQIEELMRGFLTTNMDHEGLEQTVCQWANRHSSIWEDWIAHRTACTKGNGLINETGGFTENRATARDCETCPPGWASVELDDAQGRTFQCVQCQLGRFQDTAGELRCKPCAPGTVAPRRGMVSCERCGLAEYMAAEGAVRCDRCPAGFATSFEGARSAGDCICRAGMYRGEAQRDRCMDCPIGMVCPEGSDALGLRPEHREQYPDFPQLKPGFWSSATDALSVFRCEDAVRCPGGAPGDACFEQLEGPSCQHCERGLVWNGEGCVECDNGFVKYLIFPIPVLPCLALLLVIVGVYRFSGDGPSRWDRWQNGVAAVLFLLLHHHHLLKVIQQTDTGFPEPVIRAMRYFTWSSNPMSLVDLSCSGFRSFSSQMILQSLGPAFVAAFYAVVWGVSQIIGRRYPWVKMEKNRTWNGFCSIILMFFTGIADMALTVFKCAENPNGKHSLVADRSIMCYEGDWQGLLAVGIASALVWCGGILLVCIYAVWSAPSHFHRTDVQARWKFLFVRYRVDVHWWALVIVMKGLVVNLICVIYSFGIGQLTWIFITFLIYLHATSYYRPWRSTLNNSMDTDVHLSLLLVVCASMTWFAMSREAAAGTSGGQGVLGETLVKVAIFALPVVSLPFAVTIYATRGSTWARSKKARDVERFAECVRAMAGDGEKLAQFLADLSEPDWLVMAKAKNIIEQELMAVRARMGYSVKKLSSQGSTLSSTSFISLFSGSGTKQQSATRVDVAVEDDGKMQRESEAALSDPALTEQQDTKENSAARMTEDNDGAGGGAVLTLDPDSDHFCI